MMAREMVWMMDSIVAGYVSDDPCDCSLWSKKGSFVARRKGGEEEEEVHSHVQEL